MTLKVGIIGAGQIVEDVHLPVLRNIVGIEISWIFDKNEERSRLLSKMHRISTISEDRVFDAISEIDICLLAIPLGVRYAYLQECAKSNVAVYVEKPFARNTKEHDEYCSLFDDFSISIGFQRRFYQSTCELKYIVENEIYGGLNKIEYLHGGYNLKSGGANSFITDPILSGGGVTIENAIHGLDQILHVTSANEVRLKNAHAIVMNNIDYDTVVSTVLTTSRGEVQVDTKFSKLQSRGYGFTCFFDRAVVKCKDQPCGEIQIWSLSDKKVRIEPTSDVDYGKCALNISQAFHAAWSDCIASKSNKRKGKLSADSARLTTYWVEEIYREILDD